MVRENTWIRESIGRYDLKEAFSPKKDRAAFRISEDNQQNRILCNSLLDLAANVLFVPQPGKKMPTIPESRPSSTIRTRLWTIIPNLRSTASMTTSFIKAQRLLVPPGYEKLPPLISATKMLCCRRPGHDPRLCSALMKELAMLTLKFSECPGQVPGLWRSGLLSFFMCLHYRITRYKHPEGMVGRRPQYHQPVFNTVLGMPGGLRVL